MESEVTVSPPGRREARKLHRRQAIVDAARRSFLEDGYAATSMSGLLTTLGGSKATLWSYFRSKDELFAAVIDDVTLTFCEELETGLLRSADLEEMLIAFCSGFMRMTTEPEALRAWRLIVGESGRFPELGRIFHEKAVQRIEVALAEALRAQIEIGRLLDEGATEMAQFLLSLCATRHNRQLWGIRASDAALIDADAARFVDYFTRLFRCKADIARPSS